MARGFPGAACTLHLLHLGRLRTALAQAAVHMLHAHLASCQASTFLPHACGPAAGNAIVNAAELASYDQVTHFLPGWHLSLCPPVRMSSC